MDKIEPVGTFVVEQIRDGQVILKIEGHNGITTQGKNELLKTMFSAESARIDNWYLGLMGTGAAPVAGDEMDDHAGWTEVEDVDEAARQEWLDSDTVSSQELTNAAVVEYTIDNVSGVVIDGIFVTSNSTLGGTTGILWSTGLFSSAINANDNDVIRLTYTISVS